MRLDFRTFMEAAFQAVMYHGTSINRLANILHAGLAPQPESKRSWGGDLNTGAANYITPYKQTAARYGIGAEKQQTPVILELEIKEDQQQKMFSFMADEPSRQSQRLRYDPMDRPENAWDWEDNWDDSRRYLDEAIETIYRQFAPNIRFPGLDIQDIDYLNGFDVHQYVHNALQGALGPQEFALKANEIKQAIRKELPPGSFSDDLDITPNGVIHVSPDYYKSKSQLQYLGKLHPSNIKNLYVRKDDFPHLIGQEEDFGVEYLPDESKEMMETLEGTYMNVVDELQNLADDVKDEDELDVSYWKYEVQRWIDAVEEVDYAGDDELADKLKALKEKLPKVTVEEIDKLKDIAGHHSDWSKEEWGQSIVGDIRTWVKIPRAQANKLWEKGKKGVVSPSINMEGTCNSDNG